MMIVKSLQAALFLAVLTVAGMGSAMAGSQVNLQASSVEVRATVSGMTASGGYVVIMNQGHTADRLVGVSAGFAKRSEIHDMLNENGVMKMRQRTQGIEVPAHGQVTLKPGGLHLMFMGLTQTLNAGDELSVTLKFESGHVLTVPAIVKRPSDIMVGKALSDSKNSESHDHSGHNHSGHDHSGHGS